MKALGVDCGGTGSRWLLMAEGGSTIARGELAAISGNNLVSEAFPEDWRVFLANLIDAVPYRPDAIVLGSTGITLGSCVIDRLRARIIEAFDIGYQQLVVTGDMPIAYRSILQPGEGIIIYAGTGSVVHHVNSRGESHQIGGYGEYIDDAGGGFWIGQMGLRHALRHNDIGLTTPLSEAVFDRIGLKEWSDVWQYVYSSSQPRGTIARMTEAVAQAAHEHQDEHAIAILERAGWELAQLARMMLRTTKVDTVGLLGGALCIPAVRAALLANLTDRLQYRDEGVEPVVAAAQWALTLAP